MNCVQCSPKYCRSTDSCGAEKFNTEELNLEYNDAQNQKIVQAAAALVDNGLAGNLTRLQEMILFIKSMGYKKIGLAYCYGMEEQAGRLRHIFKNEGIQLSTVSCTVGGLSQKNVNSSSCINNVSCNPIGQAKQLNAEGVDFVIVMGICLGHDVLLQKNLKADFTTFVVKDRVNNHKPLLALD